MWCTNPASIAFILVLRSLLSASSLSMSAALSLLRWTYCCVVHCQSRYTYQHNKLFQNSEVSGKLYMCKVVNNEVGGVKTNRKIYLYKRNVMALNSSPGATEYTATPF